MTVPPKPKKKNTFGLQVSLEETPTMVADNMKQVKLQDLNFKVDPDFHYEFKNTASRYRLSMKELLEQSYKLWVDSKAK